MNLYNKRIKGYINELARCKCKDCDFYLEHNEAAEFYDYIISLHNKLGKIKEEIVKYDWYNSNSVQIHNQLKSLYNEVYKENKKEGKENEKN